MTSHTALITIVEDNTMTSMPDRRPIDQEPFVDEDGGCWYFVAGAYRLWMTYTFDESDGYWNTAFAFETTTAISQAFGG